MVPSSYKDIIVRPHSVYLFIYFYFFYRSCLLLLSFLDLATTKDTSLSVSLTQWIYVRYVFYVSLDLYSWSSLMNERVLSFGKPTWVWVAYERERYSWSSSGMRLIITFLWVNTNVSPLAFFASSKCLVESAPLRCRVECFKYIYIVHV